MKKDLIRDIVIVSIGICGLILLVLHFTQTETATASTGYYTLYELNTGVSYVSRQAPQAGSKSYGPTVTFPESFFVLTVGTDANGGKFVALMESKEYRIAPATIRADRVTGERPMGEREFNHLRQRTMAAITLAKQRKKEIADEAKSGSPGKVKPERNKKAD